MRILVVEDDTQMATLLRRGLEAEGHEIVIAIDGLFALDQFESKVFDVAIVDVMMPRLDGFELSRIVRSRGDNTPILLLTAREAVVDRVSGLDSGADDYLTKPFSFDELHARLRALVRRELKDSRITLQLGDLRLEVATYRAWKREKQLILSPKEFQLLKCFMSNPDVVLTRTRILEEVWDYSENIDANVVDQYVSYLRKKIDYPYGDSSIQTVRGVGYRFVIPSDSSP
ncbi:MAG: response regulator transcription factor [Candidatus Nanopelagicaceae bacterium]|nr:response regulator transcription factor [Candidatus Nanopelagicaceae bacterium]